MAAAITVAVMAGIMDITTTRTSRRREPPVKYPLLVCTSNKIYYFSSWLRVQLKHLCSRKSLSKVLLGTVDLSAAHPFFAYGMQRQ